MTFHSKMVHNYWAQVGGGCDEGVALPVLSSLAGNLGMVHNFSSISLKATLHKYTYNIQAGKLNDRRIEFLY